MPNPPATSIGRDDDNVVHPTALHPTALHPTAPLTHFAGYEILELAGRGAMGAVFHAIDPALGRQVAIKLPHIDVAGSPRLRALFMREARITASLRHPGLVEVYRYSEVDGTCFITSKWCPGGNLATWMARHPRQRDPLVVARFIQQLCEAVAYCHAASVLHLDIKPGNILLGEESTGDDPGSPLLADFGLAKVVEQSLVETHSSMVLGTPFYMSPEQAEGRRKELGPCTDVFAIGVVLYELLHDTRPFEGQTTMQVLDNIREGTTENRSSKRSVPKPLRTICEVCLQSHPEDRYTSAQDLADDLGRFLDQRPIMARKPSKWRRLKLWLSQTERVRQAGMVTICIHFAAIGAILSFGLLIAMGVTGPFQGDLRRFLPQFIVILFTISLPSVYAGIRATKRHWWSIPVAIVFALVYFLPPFLICIGILPMPEIYQENPVAAFIVLYSNAAFAAFQVFTCCLAIPAAIRLFNRRSDTRPHWRPHD